MFLFDLHILLVVVSHRNDFLSTHFHTVSITGDSCHLVVVLTTIWTLLVSKNSDINKVEVIFPGYIMTIHNKSRVAFPEEFQIMRRFFPTVVCSNITTMHIVRFYLFVFPEVICDSMKYIVLQFAHIMEYSEYKGYKRKFYVSNMQKVLLLMWFTVFK